MAGIGTVCVDTDYFGVDDEGRLTLLIVGDRPALDWPYDCDVGTHNPIRYSEGLGLWTYPRADANSTASGTEADGTDTAWTADAQHKNLQVISFDVTNPSNCLEAVGFIVIRLDAAYTLPATPSGDPAYIELFMEYDKDDGGGYDPTDRWYRDENPSTTREVHKDQQYESNRLAGTFDPGETKTIKARLSATAADNTHVTSTRLSIHSFLVTKAS